MNFKLIKQNSYTDKMVVINPKKIKEISLSYEINYTGISSAELEIIQRRVGRIKYKELLNKLVYIEDILSPDKNYIIGEKSKEEKAKDIAVIAELIGKKTATIY